MQKLAILLLSSMLVAAPATRGALQDPENILVLVADDMGIDRLRAYGYLGAGGAPIAPQTESIDRLAAEGVLFRTAWSAPTCTPSRGSALTGLYPNRLGIGGVMGVTGVGDTGLRDDFETIADLLPPAYRRAIIGKWHLAGPGRVGALAQGIDHAVRCGFDGHLGTFANLTLGQSYFDWLLLVAHTSDPSGASQTRIEGEYATTVTTDIALRAIDAYGDNPWFLWVAFHAPHTPYHVPPAHLIQSPGLNLGTHIGRGKAMIEALDLEIGRLLAGIPPNIRARTTVVFYGDNGTQKDLVEAPFLPLKAKGSVYNGGIHVPLIISSSRTASAKLGSECDALVDITDLLPTVLELSGVAVPAFLDGTSLVPYLVDPATPSLRGWIYAEKFKPNFVPVPGGTIGDQALTMYHQAVRNERYKLVRRWPVAGTARLQFFDLRTDYFESNDLLGPSGAPPSALQGDFEELLGVLREMAE